MKAAQSGPTSSPQYPVLLTVPQVSAYLGIKVKTLYAKIEAGEIPHYRLGRLIRFRLDEVNVWLEGCRKDISHATGQSKSPKRKKLSHRPSGHMSLLIAKTIDEEHARYYSLDHGKSDRIEGLGKEVHDNGIIQKK